MSLNEKKLKKYKDIKIDPVLARVLDEACELPLFTLKFDKKVPKKNREIIEEVFESIRSQIEAELIARINGLESK